MGTRGRVLLHAWVYMPDISESDPQSVEVVVN
jgi:hypothetical protein